MKNLSQHLRLLTFAVIFISAAHMAAAQIKDQQTFCTGITQIVRTMTHDPDEMKREFVGVNTKSVRQWEVKHMLPYAINGIYEFESAGLKDYYRAGFIMSQSVPPYMAELLYRQILEAIEECFGRQYILAENVNVQIDSEGKEYKQFEATFKYDGTERGFNSSAPDILVRAYVMKRDEYIVSVDFLSLYTDPGN